MIKFFVFCITIFPEQAQNKNIVGMKTTFLLMTEKHEAKSPRMVRFRLGQDERIFWKAVNNKQNYLNEWVVEGTLRATQLRLTTLCVTTVDQIVHLNSFEEEQGIGFNQLLDFSLQRETMLDVMAGSSLMEGTGKVRLIPNRQHIRHSRRLSGLDKVLLKQDGKQLRICH